MMRATIVIAIRSIQDFINKPVHDGPGNGRALEGTCARRPSSLVCIHSLYKQYAASCSGVLVSNWAGEEILR